MATFAKCPPGLQNLWANHVRCLHLSAFLSHLKVLRRPVCTANDYNPILNQESLPRFSEIQPSHVAPAMEGLYSKFESDFGVFEAKLKSKYWFWRNCKGLTFSLSKKSPHLRFDQCELLIVILGFDYKKAVDNPWTTIIEPLEEIASRLSYAWKVTSHLNGVRNSPELRIAFEKVGQIKWG